MVGWGGVIVLRCHVAVQHSNKTVKVQVLGWVLSSAGGFLLSCQKFCFSRLFPSCIFHHDAQKRDFTYCRGEGKAEDKRRRGRGESLKKNGRQRQTGSGDSDRERADSWDSSRGESIDPGE